jgi:hypothetical protein
VSAVLDTGQIPKADRAEAVRAAVAEHLVPVEIDFAADRGPAAAPLAITDLADLTVWTSTSNAVKVQLLGQFIGSNSGMEGAPTALLNRSV